MNEDPDTIPGEFAGASLKHDVDGGAEDGAFSIPGEFAGASLKPFPL